MKSKTLNDYYKEHLSDYRSWNQLSHADEYMYFKDNLGENISIDETAFSNGELYTIVTNKDGHGKHGTVIAMIKGTKADDVCRYLMKLPEGKRRMVKNVTLDMAGSMRQIVKRCFPYATQIIDRFHVQMQMQEALQELRVQYRWQAIEQENSDIKKRERKGENIYLNVLRTEIP